MKKYEYISIYKKNGMNVDEQLNELGQKGWKIVGVRPTQDNSFIHLMRKISKKRAIEEELTELKDNVKKLVE